MSLWSSRFYIPSLRHKVVRRLRGNASVCTDFESKLAVSALGPQSTHERPAVKAAHEEEPAEYSSTEPARVLNIDPSDSIPTQKKRE